MPGPIKTPGSSMNAAFFTPAALRIRSFRRSFAQPFRIALFAALAFFGLAGASLHAQSANSLFKSGQSAEAREDYDTAFDFYQKASAKESQGPGYRTALYRVRVSASGHAPHQGAKAARQSGDEQGALAEFLHAAEIDPGNEAAQQEIATLRQKNGQSAPQGRSPACSPPASSRNRLHQRSRSTSNRSPTSRSPST
jgi:general secretion pathway protein D